MPKGVSKSKKPVANKAAATPQPKKAAKDKTGQNSKVLNAFFCLLATERALFQTSLYRNAAGAQTEVNFVRDVLGDRIPDFVSSSTPPPGMHLEWHKHWEELHKHMKSQVKIANLSNGPALLNNYRTPEGKGVKMLYSKGEALCKIVTEKVSYIFSLWVLNCVLR